MEIIDIGRKGETCQKCHGDLSTDEKMSKIPICTKCIAELVKIVKNGIDASSIEEFSNDVSDFSDFVSSSARLMGLEDIVVVQVCFNTYMDGVRDLADESPNVAKKILKDTRRFIDIELERLGDGENDPSKECFEDREIFEKMVGSISKMMKDFRVPNDRNGVKNSVDSIANGKRVGNVSGEDDVEKDSGNGDKSDSKKDNKSGSRRIRVD